MKWIFIFLLLTLTIFKTSCLTPRKWMCQTLTAIQKCDKAWNNYRGHPLKNRKASFRITDFT